MTNPVRVRFCPSPTGDPHVGLIRTALFNWAFARHHGGAFIFRIEDTDAARDSEESYEALLAAMRWLGLAWDEGPEVGGPYGPYRQSQRSAIYADVLAALTEAGFTYPCFCTPAELDQRRAQARAAGRSSGYDGRCGALSPAERTTLVADAHAAGTGPVIRFRMPERTFTWDDCVRGEVSVAGSQVGDYVIVRATGEPLYPFVNPVDDALMAISHVLRGEDLLSSTPRQIALHEALAQLGIGAGIMPQFGHLPYVMGEGNAKLSKRDPQAALSTYQAAGFLPQGLLNYLALLGWSPGEDQEFFTLDEMAAAFDIHRVNPSPARFDLAKARAINARWIRALPLAEFTDHLIAALQRQLLMSAPATAEQRTLIAAAAPLVQERMETLDQAGGLLGFLLISGPPPVEPAAASLVTGDGALVIAAAHTALTGLVPSDWHAEQIEAVLRTALVVGLGRKPRDAFTPVRAALTGRRVSPPLFESIELLGRAETLARLAAHTATA